DAPGLLPGAPAAGALLGRQVLLGRGGPPRVDDHALGPGGDVQLPQPRHLVGARGGALEDDAGGVRDEREVPPHPDGEPARPGVQARKALGHGHQSCQCRYARNMSDRRLLPVPAHPDDESITTGATIAKYAAEGAHVTLVTCTLGEEGEIIPPELAHLAADREDRLGEHRIGELAAACAALGVRDHRFLGGPGRWRDSGMMGAASNDDPRCFWRADVDEAAGELVKIIREVRPQVLVTYDENGFYGHPDHIQAHRVAWRAFHLAADPGYGEGEPWPIAKFYHTAMPRSVI